MEEAIGKVQQAIRGAEGKPALEARMNELEKVANTWLKPYPQASIRENIEVLLVAIAVAMAIRTFIVQPFKIPTGSMQPTLFGVTSNPDFMHGFLPANAELKPDPDFDIPPIWKRFFIYWFTGIGYNHIVAEADGQLDPETRDTPSRFLLFNLRQDFYIGGKKHTAWFPPENFLQRAGLISPHGNFDQRKFTKGQEIVKMKSISGDHLFVDRITYNFRRPIRTRSLPRATSRLM